MLFIISNYFATELDYHVSFILPHIVYAIYDLTRIPNICSKINHYEESNNPIHHKHKFIVP